MEFNKGYSNKTALNSLKTSKVFQHYIYLDNLKVEVSHLLAAKTPDISYSIRKSKKIKNTS